MNKTQYFISFHENRPNKLTAKKITNTSPIINERNKSSNSSLLPILNIKKNKEYNSQTFDQIEKSKFASN